MRPMIWAGFASSILCVASPAGAQNDAQRDELLRQVLEELRATNRQLAELNARVEALAETIESPANEEDGGGGPRLAALRQIVLPEQASREQVAEYIDRIAAATRGQDEFSDDDPQVDMLAAAGKRDFESLLDALGRHDDLDWYVTLAITQIAREAHKPLVLQRLARQPDLIEVVVERQWVADARETLVRELARNPRRLPQDWIEAVVELRDPATYDALTQYLVHAPGRLRTYQQIRDLPGIDLRDAVARAWAQGKNEHHFERLQAATIAVDYGHEDALSLLIDQLKDDQQGHPFHVFGPVGDVRSTVLLHIDFHGTNAEIREWYKENRGKLRFDDAKKRFFVSSGIS